VPKLFIEEAAKQDVDTAVMSTSTPYDTANYPNAKAIVSVYGNQGTEDATEGSDQNQASAPNIPAGLDIMFGKEPAKGQLPVDIPKIDENYQLTDTVKFPLGHGLKTNESGN